MIYALVMLIITTLPALSYEKKIRIYFRSFIPIEHRSVEGYSNKTSAGTWVIKAPGFVFPGLDIDKLRGTCFSTDDRMFDTSPDKSARASVDIDLRFSSSREFEVVYVSGKSSFTDIGLTRNVDCASGQDIQPPRRADGSGIIVGSVRKNANLRIFSVRGAASDPFYQVAGVSVAPSLDFDLSFEFNQITKELKIKGSTGVFPAFEGYAIIGEKTQTLFQMPPTEGSTPYSLFEMGTGLRIKMALPPVEITTRNVQSTLSLKDFLLN